MPYHNDLPLNVLIQQTSASIDGTGKYRFQEIPLSGSNLVLILDSGGNLVASRTISSITINNVTASNISASGYISGSGGWFNNLAVVGVIEGTSSWANNSISSSYANTSSYTLSSSYALSSSNSLSSSFSVNSVSASYAPGSPSVSSSYALTSSFATTAATAATANTASYVVLAQTASYVLGSGVSGTVTSASYALTSSFATTASYASNVATTALVVTTAAGTADQVLVNGGTSAVTGAVTVSLPSRVITSAFSGSSFTSSITNGIGFVGTASYANAATSASYALSSSFATNASTATTANTASYVVLTQTASYYGGTVISASYALTSSFAVTSSIANHPLYIKSLSSGCVIGGNLTINALTSSRFDVQSGSGYIVDSWTDINNPQIHSVVWAPFTNVTASYISSSYHTHIGINKNGELLQYQDRETNSERRSQIMLGEVIHPDFTTIQSTIDNFSAIASPIEQFRDLLDEIKFINGGNVATPNGVNLNINKNEATLFGQGINFSVDRSNPHRKVMAAKISASFFLETQVGNGVISQYNIVPGNYDAAGVVTAVPGGVNKSTNQRVYLLPSNDMVVQYGQTVYNTLTDAVQGIQQETFITNPYVADDAILITVISLRAGAVNLSDSDDARFFSVSKFGEASGVAGGISTSTLQQAYDNSITPEILTDGIGGSLTIRRGSASDTDMVLDIQNNSGSITAYITGNGLISGSSLLVSGGVTASLLGTSSWSNNSISASYVLGSGVSGTVTSASYALTASFATNASLASTASYVLGSGVSGTVTSASYALTSSFATTASYASNVATTALVVTTAAGTADQVLVNGGTSAVTGAVTVSLPSRVITSAFSGSSFTSSITSGIGFVGTASYANAATSASYALTSSFATNSALASTASYVVLAQTASYYGGAVTSASYALTSSFAERATGVDSVLITGGPGNSNNYLTFVSLTSGYNPVYIDSTNLTYDDSVNLLSVPTIRVNNSTDVASFNDTSAALQVYGGAFISKSLWVSGSINVLGNFTVFGSSSVVNISSSTVNINDNIIKLNAFFPYERYAGIEMNDSASATVSASLLWDGFNDYWITTDQLQSSSIMIQGPTGSLGSEVGLTTNTIPKAYDQTGIIDSKLMDDGTTLRYTGTTISSSIFLGTTGSLTYATGALITYITGSFNTITITTGSSVPSTSTQPGMPGQIAIDDNFIYVYTNNKWKRVSLSRWI